MYKLSYIYKVANTNKHPKADYFYWLFKTDTTPYLFTSEDLEQAKNRAEKNESDIPSERMFYPTNIAYHYYLLSGIGVGFLLGTLVTMLVCGNYDIGSLWGL